MSKTKELIFKQFLLILLAITFSVIFYSLKIKDFPWGYLYEGLAGLALFAFVIFFPLFFLFLGRIRKEKDLHGLNIIFRIACWVFIVPALLMLLWGLILIYLDFFDLDFVKSCFPYFIVAGAFYWAYRINRLTTVQNKDKTSSKTLKKFTYALLTILTLVWLCLSFILPYFGITNQDFDWMFFSGSLSKYFIYFFPISILGIIYVVTKGKFRETKKHLKVIIAIAAILVVSAFTLIRWTTLTTQYGQYGLYSENADDPLIFYFRYAYPENVSPFEGETLYREALQNRYDVAFKQIIMFDILVLGGAFLLIGAIQQCKTKTKNK